MKIIIPVSGRTKSELFGGDETPKCLMKINGDKTILDYQYEILSKYGIRIIMVTGYKCDDIIRYVRDKNYDIDIIIDVNWEAEYSLPRMIREIPTTFRDDFIMIFGDTLFKDDLMEKLINNDYDVYKCANARKFSYKGAIALVEAVNLNYQIKALDAPIFFKIQELNPDLKIMFNENQPVWQFDVDNRNELNQARGMNL